MPKAVPLVTPTGDVVHRKPVVGDMKWDGCVWRRWSGRRWARAAYSLHPERLQQPARLDTGPAADAGTQQRALGLAVEDQVSKNGADVVFTGPKGVVLGYRRRVSHVLHAILTLLTGGLWVIVWLVAALSRREERVRLEVDRWGNVWAVPLAGWR